MSTETEDTLTVHRIVLTCHITPYKDFGSKDEWYANLVHDGQPSMENQGFGRTAYEAIGHLVSRQRDRIGFKIVMPGDDDHPWNQRA